VVDATAIYLGFGRECTAFGDVD